MTSKAIAVQYANAIWNEKNLNAMDQLLHDEVLIHSLLGGFRGKEAMKSVVQAWLKGFPDLYVENELIISEGDLITLQWRAHGTHLGEFKGKKSSGNSVAYSGVTIYRVIADKIVEYWAYLDMKHLLDQID